MSIFAEDRNELRHGVVLVHVDEALRLEKKLANVAMIRCQSVETMEGKWAKESRNF